MNQKGKEKSENRIVLTAGHAATTALATVEELVRRNKPGKSWKIFFIGAQFAVEGLKAPTLESLVLPKVGVSFHPLISGRVQRKLTFWTLPSLLKIPLGFIHAFLLLKRIKPAIIVSFGGYSAFPVVVVGWILRIPVVIHEQTSAVGRANLFSAPFAQRIALARGESINYFPNKKIKVIGNPILSNILAVAPKSVKGNPAVIYITGGSRGSQTMNEVISQIIKRVVEKYRVVHHTGYFDYEKFIKIKKSLDKNLRESYEVHKVIDPNDIASVYQRADIVISRAGANTVSEIIATKRPAILIPIPFSYKDEQTKNAQFAQKYGLARILLQSRLTKESLLKEINKLDRNWDDMVKKVKNKKSPDINAAKNLVGLIEEILK